MITYRRPKISLSRPARPKETDDAIDQPDTIQPMSVVSPRSVPIWTRIEVAMRNPLEMGATGDMPKN